MRIRDWSSDVCSSDLLTKGLSCFVDHDFEPLDAHGLGTATFGRTGPQLVRRFFALSQGVLTLPERNPHHPARAPVGKRQHSLTPRQLLCGRSDLFLDSLDPFVVSFWRTTQLTDPLENLRVPP